MSFVMKNKHTAQLFSCELINIYELSYIGVKAWETREEAESEWEAFLLVHDIQPSSDWELLELTEHQMKMCNVKLANNPRRRVYMSEQGTLETRE